MSKVIDKEKILADFKGQINAVRDYLKRFGASSFHNGYINACEDFEKWIERGDYDKYKRKENDEAD